MDLENCRVVIDTDGGVDDALSLMLAGVYFETDSHNFCSKKPLLHAVTTSYGNVHQNQAHSNVHELLMQSVPNHAIPIISGAHKPMTMDRIDGWPGHGVDGLGGSVGVTDPSITQENRLNHAVAFLIDTVNKYPHQITILALGPLTNLALACLMDAQFHTNVKQVILMGGTNGIGNVTKYAEFNFASDPEAAHIFFTHFVDPKRLFITSWTLCFDYQLGWEFFDELTKAGHTNSSLIKKYFQTYEQLIRLPEKRSELELAELGFCPCDAYATAALVDSSYITEVKLGKVQIELKDADRRGQSTFTFIEKSSLDSTDPPTLSYISKIDVQCLREMLMKLVQE